MNQKEWSRSVLRKLKEWFWAKTVNFYQNFKLQKSPVGGLPYLWIICIFWEKALIWDSNISKAATAALLKTLSVVNSFLGISQ